jgi:hypothetical protein
LKNEKEMRKKSCEWGRGLAPPHPAMVSFERDHDRARFPINVSSTETSRTIPLYFLFWSFLLFTFQGSDGAAVSCSPIKNSQTIKDPLISENRQWDLVFWLLEPSQF